MIKFYGGLDIPCRLSLPHQPQLNVLTQMNSNLRIPDAIDSQRLAAMQLVAKLKESADKHGVGFVGGFIAPNGEKFMMSNMDEDDTNALLPEDLR